MSEREYAEGLGTTRHGPQRCRRQGQQGLRSMPPRWLIIFVVCRVVASAWTYATLLLLKSRYKVPRPSVVCGMVLPSSTVLRSMASSFAALQLVILWPVVLWSIMLTSRHSQQGDPRVEFHLCSLHSSFSCMINILSFLISRLLALTT